MNHQFFRSTRIIRGLLVLSTAVVSLAGAVAVDASGTCNQRATATRCNDVRHFGSAPLRVTAHAGQHTNATKCNYMRHFASFPEHPYRVLCGF